MSRTYPVSALVAGVADQVLTFLFGSIFTAIKFLHCLEAPEGACQDGFEDPEYWLEDKAQVLRPHVEVELPW